MKEDLLFDALSEIDDRHIEEAATYVPKTKVLTPKKIIAAAACVAVVAVSAFAVKNYGHTFINPDNTTQEDTFAATYAAVGNDTETYKGAEEHTDTAIPTDTVPAFTMTEGAQTEIAGETEIYMESTVGCTIAPRWEERSITSKYNKATVNGKEYTTGEGTVEYEDLERVLCYADLTGTDYHSDATYTTSVTVYKIKEFSEEAFVAIKFEEDDSFFIYERTDYKPDTVKDLLSDTSFEKYASVNMNTQVLHEEKDAVIASATMSDITDEVITALVTLLKNNPDVPSEDGFYDDSNNHISFGFTIKDMDCHAHFNDKGRLTLDVANGYFSFKFTEEEYDEFVKIIEKNEEVSKPLSEVTTPTTEGSAGTPDGVVTTPAVPPTTATEPAVSFYGTGVAPENTTAAAQKYFEKTTASPPEYKPTTQEDILSVP